MANANDSSWNPPPEATATALPPALPAAAEARADQVDKPDAAQAAQEVGFARSVQPGGGMLPRHGALSGHAARGPGGRSPAYGGRRPSSGITLAEVLLSPLEEFAALLGGVLPRRRAEPRPAQTMTEWVQQGLPAFAFPEDVRGSFMDHVI